MSIKTVVLFDSTYRNFTYLLISSSQLICIDPFDGDIVLSYGPVHMILTTHEHLDHVCGIDKIVRVCHAPVGISHKLSFASKNVSQNKQNWQERHLRDGFRLCLDEDNELEVWETPGHTMAHLCYLWFKKGKPYALFSGDTIFNAGVGNCKSGDPEALYYSTLRVATLPDDVLLYPGHDYVERNYLFTLSQSPNNKEIQDLLEEYRQKGWEQFIPKTLGFEKKYNLFFQASSKEDFLRLRLLRDQWG